MGGIPSGFFHLDQSTLNRGGARGRVCPGYKPGSTLARLRIVDETGPERGTRSQQLTRGGAKEQHPDPYERSWG